MANLKKILNSIAHWCCQFWHKNWWNKLITIVAAIIIVLIGAMYGVGQWYIHSQADKPLEQGVSFIPDYAKSLGVDPQETMDALLGINVRHFRLVSYWNDLEPAPGRYDFSQLDWQFKKAEPKNAKVTLALGLRQPRWPECHTPDWVDTDAPADRWQPRLEAFMRKVIERYKDSPSLESYQLENEYFNDFGLCPDHSRQRLVSEFNLVKSVDTGHPVIISRSNNLPSLQTGQPRPDIAGMSVYRRVWDAKNTHRYYTYPMPAWYYSFLAGMMKLTTGRDSMIHELQAEPWPPAGKDITDISLNEQNNTMNAKRLEQMFGFGRATGMKQMYLWGGEYWYYRKTQLHDPSLWNIVQQEFNKY